MRKNPDLPQQDAWDRAMSAFQFEEQVGGLNWFVSQDRLHVQMREMLPDFPRWWENPDWRAWWASRSATE